jgi:hypothetical protein
MQFHRQPEAVRVYERAGYRRIENFGPYVGSERNLCFEKGLAPVQAAWAVQGSTFALYHHEEHMETVEYQIWTVYGTSTPVHIGVYDGVPIIYVYENPGPARR